MLISPTGLLNDPYSSDALPVGSLIRPRLGHDCTTRLLLSPYSAGATPVMISSVHRIWGNLIRVEAALLVGDRLIVDRKLCLRVIANRVKEAVRISHDTGRSEGDDLVQSRRGFDRKLCDLALIDVCVRRWIALDQFNGMTNDFNA